MVNDFRLQLEVVLDEEKRFHGWIFLQNFLPFYVGVQGAEQVQYATNKVAGKNLFIGL